MRKGPDGPERRRMNLEELEQKARDKVPFIVRSFEGLSMKNEIEKFLNLVHEFGYRYRRSHKIRTSEIVIIVERMA